MDDAAALANLLARAARGDRAAFADLYRATAPQLYPLALRILKRKDRADDALQEAFVSVWRAADRYDAGKGSVRVWLTGIVRNRAIDMIRRSHREILVADAGAAAPEPADSGPDPLRSAIMAQDARAVADCLDRLEAMPRTCLKLAFFDGYTHDELARRLDKPIGSVKSWIRRGLLAVKRCLET